MQNNKFLRFKYFKSFIIFKGYKMSEIDSVRKYFTLCAESNTNKCNIEGCIKIITGNYKHNLKRHIVCCHKDVAKQENWIILDDSIEDNSIAKKSKRDLKVSLDEATVRRGCIEMVSVHAMPLKLLDYEGFKRILDPITAALNITISSRTIPTDIKSVANQIKAAITKKISDRLICLKMDIASRHGRSVLGVNCQIINDGKIEIFTLGMITLEKRHTAANLKTEVLDILKILLFSKFNLFLFKISKFNVYFFLHYLHFFLIFCITFVLKL